jgi:UDP-N-acetyl-alpha-D-muramoyl-L-alanyl-L-glutamate epimerase
VIKNNQKKYNLLRDEFDVFTFENFQYNDTQESLEVVFQFNMADRFNFQPRLSIPNRGRYNRSLPRETLDALVFNIGMIELISYWKAACPPKIIIKPFRLTHEQQNFWKKLYFNGLGEFFYTNGIQNDPDTFVKIESQSNNRASKFKLPTDPNRVIIPVGGGKDSVVTLELLGKECDAVPFVMNPGKAITETTRIAGFSGNQVMVVNRTLDSGLLQLNEKGFLNGHTPFSALLGFVSLLTAAMTESKYIALSNESSANEPTTSEGINHQYSKSYAFEKDFRCYVTDFMTDDIEYFSFLRPMNEYGIARIFSGLSRYFKVFRSCNAGSKSDLWCGACSKCLFTFIILSPFIDSGKLEQIFGKDLFEDESLIPVLRELSGAEQVKPFECVGTTDEVITALNEAVKNRNTKLPSLLEYFVSEIYPLKAPLPVYDTIANAFDHNHFLNDRFLAILKSGIHG